MLLGTMLLTITLLALAVALGSSLLDLIRPEPRHRRRARLATWSATATGWLAFLLLAALFLAGDISVGYVWRNIDLTYPWYQRISGLWVGREGSLLLWTLLLLAFWSIEELRHLGQTRRGGGSATLAGATLEPRRKHTDATDEDVEALRRVARVALVALALALLSVVALKDIFGPTAPIDQAELPLGRGVNPQLVTFYNAIHPPVVFTGYALAALPFAFAFAHLATGRPGWVGAARRWAHPAFTFLTLGVLLGGLWAYIALGWGGYWAWDPVEVGSLVPWAFVTAFLHAALRHDHKGEFAVAAPALGFLLLPAVLFSTFIVRANGVWRSVHNFLGEGRADSAWERFVLAFQNESEVKLYAILLGALLVGFIVLLFRHVERIEARETAKPRLAPTPAVAAAPALPDRLLAHLTLANLFVVGTLLLALLGTVLVTILVMGVDGFASTEAAIETFESRTAPIALTLALVMALAVGHGALPRRRLVELMGLALALGFLAGVLVFPGHIALATAGSMLIAVLVIVLHRISVAWRDAPRRDAGRLTAAHLVHLGVVLVLLGHGVVSAFASESGELDMRIGETRQVGDYTVRLDAIDSDDRDQNGRLDHIVATLTVGEEGEELGTVDVGFILYANRQHYKPEVGILRTIGKDVYLSPRSVHDPIEDRYTFANLPFDQQAGAEVAEVDGISFDVATLPYINLVWAGGAAMVLGGTLLTTHTWLPTRRTASDLSPAPRARTET